MQNALSHVRARWPEAVVPPNEPAWLYYELNYSDDIVARTVEVFEDGQIKRNSIEIEERMGGECPSLIDTGIADAFEGVELTQISAAEFEALWIKGEDTPFWNAK